MRVGSFPSPLKLLRRRPFAVLVYHEVADGGGTWSVSRRALEDHLRYLRGLGCTFVTTGQILKSLVSDRPLPHRAVCLHFDDARAGFFREAFPLLDAHGVPSTVFVVAGWAGGLCPIPETESYAPVMSWPEIVETSRSPLVEVGSHGYSHANLKRASRETLTREVALSRSVIEDRIGREVIHFAAPFNRVNRAVRCAVRRAGYRTLSAGGGKVNGRFASSFRLRRCLVTRGTTEERLGAIVERLGG